MVEKPLRISFDKIDGFIKINDGINHNFARTRNDSYNSLLIEKVLTFHDVMVLIKAGVNKNENNYYIYFFKKITTMIHVFKRLV